MAEFRFPPLKSFSSTANADASTSSESHVGTLTRIGPHEKILKLLPDPSDPLLPGPFGGCFDTEYSFSPPTHPERSYFGQVYLPGGVGKNNCATTGRFPLVIIAHADGGSPPSQAHVDYEILARHLATHGFVVASLNRGTHLGWTNDFGDVLEETVHFFLANSFVSTNLSGPVAVIGHSAGGGFVLEAAQRVRFPKSLYAGKVGRDLAALIQLVPALGNFTQAIADSASFACRAYLTILITGDTDFGTWGKKMEDTPMASGFRVYDAMGKVGSPDLSMVTKDSVFAVGISDHFCQDTPPILAYITAMLRRSVLKEIAYNNFLKHQHKPPSLKTKVFQQHEDFQRLSILRFDTPDSRVKLISPENVVTQIVTTYIDDEFSPHETKALKIIWDRSKPPGSFAKTRVLIQLIDMGVNASAFNLLSFRITQSYIKGIPPRPSRDLGVKLNGQGELRRLKDYGIEIHYPIMVPAPEAFKEQTKTAMKTVLIPLADFKVDLSVITSITFDFGVNPASETAKAEFYIDTVEFVRE